MRPISRRCVPLFALLLCFPSQREAAATREQGEALRLALRAASRLSGGWKQAAYARIAVVQARSGQRADAERSLRFALAPPPELLTHGIVGTYPAKEIALALAAVGRGEEALRVARTVPSLQYRAIAVAEVAASLTDAGARAAAFREAVILGSTLDPMGGENRVPTLIEVAYRQRAAGCTPEAVATLKVAASIAGSRETLYARLLGLIQAARLLAEFGARGAALEVFSRAYQESRDDKTDVLRPELIRAAIAVGRLDTALFEARALRAPTYRWSTLCEVGLVLANRNEVAQAAALFDSFAEEMRSGAMRYHRPQLILVYSRLAAKSNRKGQALALIQAEMTTAPLVPGVHRDPWLLVYLGRSLMELGNEAMAAQVLRDAADSERRIDWAKVKGAGPLPDSTTYLLRCLLRQGDFRAAEQVVAKFKDLEGRSYGLEQMSKAAVEHGNLGLAMRCAARIRDADSQLRAYLLIASGSVGATRDLFDQEFGLY